MVTLKQYSLDSRHGKTVRRVLFEAMRRSKKPTKILLSPTLRQVSSTSSDDDVVEVKPRRKRKKLPYSLTQSLNIGSTGNGTGGGC